MRSMPRARLPPAPPLQAAVSGQYYMYRFAGILNTTAVARVDMNGSDKKASQLCPRPGPAPCQPSPAHVAAEASPADPTG